MQKANDIETHILIVAKELFVKQGYQLTEMRDIARMANVGRSTLYRYFPSKEALASHVSIEVMRELVSPLHLKEPRIERNGWEELRDYLYLHTQTIVKKRELLKFLGEFDAIFGGVYQRQENEAAFRENLEMMRSGKNPIALALQKGINDGSIRRDIDVPLTAETITNVILAVAQRTLVRRHRLLEELGYSDEVLMRSIEMMLDGIRG